MQTPDNNYEIWGNEFNRYFIAEWLVFKKKNSMLSQLPPTVLFTRSLNVADGGG